MLKRPIALDPPPEPTRRGSRVVPIAGLFLLMPVAAPLIVEAAAICRGQWREMMGLPTEVRTPMMDWIGEQVEAVRQEARFALLSRFERVPWNPRIVIASIAVVMALAIRMLRN